MHPEVLLFVPDGIAFIPYMLPGTKDIASETVKRIPEKEVVLWKKYCVFATGMDTDDAFDKIDILAKSASVYLMVNSAGHE